MTLSHSADYYYYFFPIGTYCLLLPSLFFVRIFAYGATLESSHTGSYPNVMNSYACCGNWGLNSIR